MKKTIFPLLLLALFFLLLLFPKEVKTGGLDGLFLWYYSVVPILLPFLILSNIMIATDSLSLFLRPLSFLQKRFPGLHPILFYPVFLGLFCGFPMGAKTVADLMHSGKINLKQADLLLPFVNQASPMFLAGFVGIHILKEELSFTKILFYLYLPPLLLLFFRLLLESFFSFFSSQKTSLPFHKKNPNQLTFTQKENSMPLNMEHTIWNSFHIIVVIGIYMMLFSIAVRLCFKLLPKNSLVTFSLCLLEFSTGLNYLSGIPFTDPSVKTGLVLALTSFGGFCTAAQTASLIKDTHISMKSYLFWKLIGALGVFLLYSSS